MLDGGTGNDVVLVLPATTVSRAARVPTPLPGARAPITWAAGPEATVYGAMPDAISCSEALWTDVLAGDAGNDLLVGGSGSDKISGGLGDDRINSLDGRRDRVSGGAGSDSARADHSDVLSGIERRLRRRGEPFAASHRTTAPPLPRAAWATAARGANFTQSLPLPPQTGWPAGSPAA